MLQKFRFLDQYEIEDNKNCNKHDKTKEPSKDSPNNSFPLGEIEICPDNLLRIGSFVYFDSAAGSEICSKLLVTFFVNCLQSPFLIGLGTEHYNDSFTSQFILPDQVIRLVGLHYKLIVNFL